MSIFLTPKECKSSAFTLQTMTRTENALHQGYEKLNSADTWLETSQYRRLKSKMLMCKNALKQANSAALNFHKVAKIATSHLADVPAIQNDYQTFSAQALKEVKSIADKAIRLIFDEAREYQYETLPDDKKFLDECASLYYQIKERLPIEAKLSCKG